jgi:hypothetical protein
MLQHKRVVDAVLSAEGDEGYAMIGDGGEIGPAAFAPIVSDEEPGTEEWTRAARAASEQALRKLQARFPDRQIRGEWQAPQ